jgi:hypothetical protein
MVGRDTICPSCIYNNHGGKEAHAAALAEMKQRLGTCQYSGCNSKDTDTYFNGIDGFCSEEHMQLWYKETFRKPWPGTSIYKNNPSKGG